MKARIKIPEDLSRYCAGHSVFDVDSGDFYDALSELITRYPDLGPRLLRNDGLLLSHLVVFARGQTVPPSSLSQIVITDGDELEIMFLASGG